MRDAFLSDELLAQEEQNQHGRNGVEQPGQFFLVAIEEFFHWRSPVFGNRAVYVSGGLSSMPKRETPVFYAPVTRRAALVRQLPAIMTS